MVPTDVSRNPAERAAACRRLARGTLGLLVALSLPAGCGGGDSRGEGDEASYEQTAAELVRARYSRGDAVAAGAWTWEGPGGLLFVLVDVQSAIPDLVQGRLDLWAVAGDSVSGVGRSEVMVSAAEFGAFVFDDLTGDGLPDLLGYVADSAGTSYPVFVPGATGTMNEELEQAAPRYRFSADPLEAPSAVAGCALRLWAEEPVPDGAAAGWRFLALRAGGALGRPSVATPTCAAEAPQ